MSEYAKHEFCRDIKCTMYDDKKCYVSNCIHSAKKFHKWLKQNNYKIVKGE